MPTSNIGTPSAIHRSHSTDRINGGKSLMRRLKAGELGHGGNPVA
jgi:hypothetical protein